MARYRQVHFDMWDDPHFSEFSRDQRWLFVSLFTNKFTKQCESGIYEISIQQMYEITKIPKQTLIKLLSNPGETPGKLTGNPGGTVSYRLGMGLRNVIYDFDNMIVFVANFREYQKMGGDPAKIKIAIANEYKRLKKSPLWNEFFRLYPEFAELQTNPLETPGKPTGNPLETPGERFTTTLNDNVNVNVNDNVKRLKKDVNVSGEPEQNVDKLVNENVNRIKLMFIEMFNNLPYPYRTNDKAREKLHLSMDNKLVTLLTRARGDPEPFINCMKSVKQKKGSDVGSLKYFLEGYNNGASIFDKLCDQLVFDEHHRVKAEFAKAIDQQKALKMIANKLVESEQPDWMRGAIQEYKKLIQKYELSSDATEKDMLKNQLVAMQKRFGL